MIGTLIPDTLNLIFDLAETELTRDFYCARTDVGPNGESD
jgi:hypothetical protein